VQDRARAGRAIQRIAQELRKRHVPLESGENEAIREGG
jgi:hypothetical protein